MTTELFFHPLSSFCWKALIALYENATPFEPRLVDFGNAESRDAFFAIWPLGKFPVLRDRGHVIPESTIIIEYLAQHHPGPVALVPADSDRAREARLRDRFYDGYVHRPMQQIVGDSLRPDGAHDPYGVAQARAQLRTSYKLVEADMAERTWALGDDFTLADCAAAPALYYADLVEPLGDAHPHTAAYLARLVARPSIARVIAEASPYFVYSPAHRGLK